jgi:methylthioribose-1-phosphate isomerase
MDVRTKDKVCAIKWSSDRLLLLDQRLLPERKEYVPIDTCRDATHAIRDMVVRGAPAIGITAAYAVVLAVRAHVVDNPKQWRESIEADLQELSEARPTAVNLCWAVDRMRRTIAAAPDSDPVDHLLAEARSIHDQDIAANRRMGALGAELLNQHATVLTHCNAGALATGGYGTALGVIRAGFEAGKIKQIYAGETRPWLQGARLTAWELLQDDIPVMLLPDSAAAHIMRSRGLDWVVVGADRVAANGDVANKIGTYSLAVLAREHGVGFMVVAPTSTIDRQLEDGADIDIEFRDGDEVLTCGGTRVAPEGARAFNAVFDVTPAALIDYLVTEKGVVARPNAAGIRALYGD